MVVISKQWIKKNYIELNKTAQECATARGCSTDKIYDTAKRYGLTKKVNGVYEDKSLFKHSQKGVSKSMDHKKKIMDSQPHRKVVQKISAKGRLLAEYESIHQASKISGVQRENIRSCLHGKRKKAGGFMWTFRRTYGEELIKRVSELDFTLPIDEMIKGVYVNLPKKMNREDATKYYNRKLKAYWSFSA